MQETKTKSRTEICKILLLTFIILGAVLIFTAPFWHVNFSKETVEIRVLKEKLQSLEMDLSSKRNELKIKYQSGIIEAEEFISLSNYYDERLRGLKSENDMVISTAIDDQRIFSWKNPRAFLLGLGVRLPYVFFSIIISLLIMSRRNDPKHLKNALLFLQIASWSISAYWMIWVFWNFQDYSLNTYRYAFILAAVLIGTACTYFLSNFENTIDVLKSKIRYVMNLMVNQALANGHIRDEDKYEDEIIFPALKKLDE